MGEGAYQRRRLRCRALLCQSWRLLCVFFCLSALSLGLFVFSVFSQIRCSFRPSSSLRLHAAERVPEFFLRGHFISSSCVCSQRPHVVFLTKWVLVSQVRCSSLATICSWSRFQVHRFEAFERCPNLSLFSRRAGLFCFRVQGSFISLLSLLGDHILCEVRYIGGT